MPEKPLWTSETAKEASKKGLDARQRYAEARKEDPLFDVKRLLPELFQDLLRAARGMPPFRDLPPEKRLMALTKAIEYGAGRPVTLDRLTPRAEDEDDDGREKPGSLVIE